MRMRVGDTFPKHKHKFHGSVTKDGDKYFIIRHWLGLEILPIKKWVTLEFKRDMWEVIKIEGIGSKKTKADNFLKEDFNKYSGFNTKSNTKVRIGEHK